MKKHIKVVNASNQQDVWNVKGDKKSYLISALITLIPTFVLYYLALPALNIKSQGLWLFVLAILVFYVVILVIYCSIKRTRFSLKPAVLSFGVLLAVFLLVNFFSARLFHAKGYSQILNVQDGEVELIPSVEKSNSIALMDTASAERLGDRKIGSLSGVVSQYNVGEYIQINKNDAPAKVSSLAYDGFFKWMSNKDKGIPGYVIVNPVDMSADYISLESGMKYVPSAYFSKDLHRHIRFKYPTVMFGNLHFEVDEEGKPWYVCSVYDHTIALFGGTKITGAILVDPISGACEKYEAGNVPQWVDVVFPGDLICEQYNDYAQLQHGYFNRLFAQKDCRQVTTMERSDEEGESSYYPDYGYIAKDGDIWIYTGVTSVNGDSSNIGFILANERTSETRFISSAGADEFSSMKSAEGEVQEKGYTASFPSLINVDGTPTYIMVLKDANNLVKMYAAVNVEQYNLVTTATSQDECISKYKSLIHRELDISSEDDSEYTKVNIKVQKIQTVDIDGNTWIYIVDEKKNIYRAKYIDVIEMVLVEEGDTISVMTNGDLFRMK
ncbi:MAG: hypothetical protein IJ875_03355 [Solobacterium sp.]|nr:hypothetical protein [Solobacterium sp.]